MASRESLLTFSLSTVFPRLAAGIVMIATLGKQNVDYLTGKRNISSR